MRKTFLCICLASLLTACGGAKSVVKVRNGAESTETTISVNGVQGGSTQVEVSPDVDIVVKLNPTGEDGTSE